MVVERRGATGGAHGRCAAAARPTSTLLGRDLGTAAQGAVQGLYDVAPKGLGPTVFGEAQVLVETRSSRPYTAPACRPGLRHSYRPGDQLGESHDIQVLRFKSIKILPLIQLLEP